METVEQVRAAEELLGEALAAEGELHLPGVRGLYRRRLERVVALTSELQDAEEELLRRVWTTRALAQAARAEDARYGAGQLSRSAQRAPTEEDCALGWRNVEGIVGGAEIAAADVLRLVARLEERGGGGRALTKAAALASSAAKEARLTLERRNHAYTFHADPGFSFGEGWYVAAAAVLRGVSIQIEDAQPQSKEAERFLRDAGLGARLVPYRSRPRANKALPALIARCFLEEPDAQRRLRAAFLGKEGVNSKIVEWAKRALGRAGQAAKDAVGASPKVLVWVRSASHDAERNSKAEEVLKLCRVAEERGVQPVLFGDSLAGGAPEGVLDLTLCWKLPLFQGAQMRRAQLQLFEQLKDEHGVIGQVGVTTAGMDGPALLGLPTMYITDAPNPRLGRWVGAVPGYTEVLRRRGYLGEIGEAISRWASS